MMQYPFRTRFKKEIVAEFLPALSWSKGPRRDKKGTYRPQKTRVIILCDGMPSVPNRRSLMQFLSKKGYWVFHPRYRGAWESGGQFLAKSPHLDILDVVSELKGSIKEAAYGKKFPIKPDEIFIIGGSFGGPAAILCSLDPRVKKVVANCPVVDWPSTKKGDKVETTKKNYAAYVREAFGNGYRLSDKNWQKLYSGKFYSPMHHIKEINPSKIIMFHAKDDPVVDWKTVAKFSKLTGVKLKLLKRGGHISTPYVVEKYWKQINAFLKSR